MADGRTDRRKNISFNITPTLIYVSAVVWSTWGNKILVPLTSYCMGDLLTRLIPSCDPIQLLILQHYFAMRCLNGINLEFHLRRFSLRICDQSSAAYIVCTGTRTWRLLLITRSLVSLMTHGSTNVECQPGFKLFAFRTEFLQVSDAVVHVYRMQWPILHNSYSVICEKFHDEI